jgi:putative ABC transport system permease protein
VQDIGLVALAIALVVAMTVTIADHLIAERVARVEDENSANLFVYDLQVDQVAEVETILKRHEARIIEIVPIVLMRLVAVKGVESDTLLSDPASAVPARTLRRDYWSSYRAETVSNEEIIAGEWVARVDSAPLFGTAVPISIEERLAGRLGVTVGDSLEFDLQGVRIPVVVGSIRKVFWERMRRNAFVIFPDGPLNEAPQFRFLTARVSDPRIRAAIQRELAEKLPGISVVDVTAAVRSVTDALGEIRSAIAGLTGLVVLVALLVVLACADIRADVVRDGNKVLQLVGARRNVIARARRLESLAESLGALSVGFGAALGIGALMGLYLFRTGVSFPWGTLMVIGAIGVVARFVAASTVLPRTGGK